MTDQKPPPIDLAPTYITDKPDKPADHGSPGGASGSGGWSIGFGSGGGSGFFSGGFGGSSSKKAKRRARARKRAAAQQRAEAAARAKAEAEAKAQALREALHQQLIQQLVEHHQAKRTDLDQQYASKRGALSQALDTEILAAKGTPQSPGAERWQLYLISKQQMELEGVTLRKNSELQARQTQSLAFNGLNPLEQDVASFQQHLTHYSAGDTARAQDAQDKWEASYTAAQEAALLSESIRLLNERAQALAAHYIEQAQRWREIEALEKQRHEYAVRREEQITYKTRTDEQSRQRLVETANSLEASSASVRAGALVWSRGAVLVADGAAQALTEATWRALKELGRVAAIRAGQTLTVSLSALLYSRPLDNGELTPEQRRHLFSGASVGAEALGLPDGADLPAIASAGGSVDVATRIKAIPAERGAQLIGITTGGAVSARVPVINATYDPLTDTYRAQTASRQPRQVIIAASPPVSETTDSTATEPRLFISEPEVGEVLAGVDMRVDDCIVCFPAESGLAPQYFSFETLAPDSGAVIGNGEVAGAGWWSRVAQEPGLALPAQVGERLRYRQFDSLQAFDRAVWRVIAEDSVLGPQFDEVNRKRMARGYAPYAPKSTWTGDRREFEIRRRDAANDAASGFDLDQLSFTRPNSDYGVRRIPHAFVAWPVSSDGTWTPLVPPGGESLGPTELPTQPQNPGIYPGGSTHPVGSQNESLPGADTDDIHANIPGYGGDDDLPSPGLELAGPPVEPLEVGPYNESSRRSRLDGLDIDHVVSRAALRKYLSKNFPNMRPRELYAELHRAASIAIPTRIHREYSETFGGRNTQAKQELDAADLRAAVDSNLNALKPELLKEGFPEAKIEAARDALHELHIKQGWYK